MFTTTLRKFALLGSIAGIILLTTPVFASTPADISIPIDTIVKNKNEGDIVELAKEQVPADLVGMECDVEAVARNQGSVHPGNNILVQSGTDSVVLADVERAPGVDTTATGTLNLSQNIVVNLELGKDGVFSAGMDVHFTCEEPEEEPIEVCREGEIITISPDELKETDSTNLSDCDPTYIEVCRDGEVISITEDKKLETDTETCPEVKGEITPPVETLPNTGFGEVASGFVGISSVAYGIRNWLESKKLLKKSIEDKAI